MLSCHAGITLCGNDGKSGNPAAARDCAAAGRESGQKFFFTLAYQ